MTRNPQQRSREDSKQATSRAYTERGTVISTDDGNAHAVTVRPESTGADEPALVSVTTRGDANQPTVGDRVLCVRRTDGKLVVVATLYAESDTVPAYAPGERIIGHPLTDAEIHLRPTGTVTVAADDGTTVDVASDGTVTIDGGSTGVIRDITTTKDSDGHVTSISLDRSSTVFIP